MHGNTAALNKREKQLKTQMTDAYVSGDLSRIWTSSTCEKEETRRLVFGSCVTSLTYVDNPVIGPSLMLSSP